MGVVLHLNFFTAILSNYNWNAPLEVNFDRAPHFRSGSVGEHFL
jgi:hypothetical protein